MQGAEIGWAGDRQAIAVLLERRLKRCASAKQVGCRQGHEMTTAKSAKRPVETA
jgi:hypothetical protein